jgi:hypothetical protein
VDEQEVVAWVAACLMIFFCVIAISSCTKEVAKQKVEACKAVMTSGSEQAKTNAVQQNGACHIQE